MHIGEAVDAGDDLGGILAEAVQDDPQRLGADLVGGLGDADRAFGGGEGLVAGQEGEALGFFAQQHGGEIAVAEADLAVVGDRTGDAEGLQADADRFGGVGGLVAAFLDGDRGADDIGPGGVLKGDRLGVLADFVWIDALGVADRLGFLDGGNAILGQGGVDLV